VLTADLVRAKKKGDELVLVGMSGPLRERALAMAAEISGTAAAMVGSSREDLLEAFLAIEASVREQRVKDGLVKLVLDRCTFGVEETLPPSAVRRAVFLRAAAARRALGPGQPFDRRLVLEAAGSELGADADGVDRALFADLKGAEKLSAFEAISATALVASYERGQAEAVLLRATRVVVTVSNATAGAARSLFRRLKFLQLLYEIAETAEGYRIVIDGPLSLFDGVTRYGQKLALLISVLDGCDAYKLEAELRWGKERVPLVFRIEQRAGSSREGVEEPSLPDDVRALARSFERLASGWRVAPSRAILHLPGHGLSVPDLVFSRGNEKVYLEVLGYWSREAVFRRVELVERGLKERIIFAISSRLRVSEELLDDRPSAALYVYKGTMSARAVADRLDQLARGSSSTA